MHVPAPGNDRIPDTSSSARAWLDHLGRFTYIRAHISTFAVGSVLLLALDLLSQGGGVWADTLIGAWAILLVVHGLIAVIARLLKELLDDDAEAGLRPASEMRWGSPSTWSRSSRQQRTPVPPPWPPTTPQPPRQSGSSPPPDTTKLTEDERVPWQAAVDTAWLAPREPANGTDEETTSKKSDDQDDFTPLKFD